eukprot:s513_g4.t1
MDEIGQWPGRTQLRPFRAVCQQSRRQGAVCPWRQLGPGIRDLDVSLTRLCDDRTGALYVCNRTLTPACDDLCDRSFGPQTLSLKDLQSYLDSIVSRNPFGGDLEPWDVPQVDLTEPEAYVFVSQRQALYTALRTLALKLRDPTSQATNALDYGLTYGCNWRPNPMGVPDPEACARFPPLTGVGAEALQGNLFSLMAWAHALARENGARLGVESCFWKQRDEPELWCPHDSVLGAVRGGASGPDARAMLDSSAFWAKNNQRLDEVGIRPNVCHFESSRWVWRNTRDPEAESAEFCRGFADVPSVYQTEVDDFMSRDRPWTLAVDIAGAQYGGGSGSANGRTWATQDREHSTSSLRSLLSLEVSQKNVAPVFYPETLALGFHSTGRTIGTGTTALLFLGVRRYFSGQSGSHGLDRQGLNTPLFVSGNRCGNLQDARQLIARDKAQTHSTEIHHKRLFRNMPRARLARWGTCRIAAAALCLCVASGAATFCIPLRQTPLPGFGRAQVGRQPPAADKARTALQNSAEEAEVVEESSSKASVLSTAVSLAKSMLGSGALSLSAGVAAFTNTSQGLLVATAIILGMTVLSAYTFQMVAEVSADTGADDLGAAWKTSFGKWAFLPRLAVGTLSGISCTVYAMILGDLLTQFVQSFLTAVPALGALKLYCSRAPVLISLTVCVLLPMCLAEDFSSLAFTSMLGLAACVYLSAFCALRALDGSYLKGGKFFRAAPYAPMALISASQLSDAVNPRVLVFLSNISTAYMNHGMAPATYQELVQSGSSKKSNLRRYALAVTLAFIITGGVCTSLMAAGFFTFGANTQGLLLANYATRDLAASLGKMGVMISILCGFPLNFMLLKSEVVAMAKKKGFSMDKPAVRWLTVALLIVTTGLALVLKDLGKVQAVTGATMGSFIVFVAPALMSRGLRRQRGGKAPGRAVQEVVLVMCGFLLGSLGVFLSITRK